jgi:hypothetical protein
MIHYNRLSEPRIGNLGDIAPQHPKFDHLFHANAQDEPILVNTLHAGTQTVALDFMRNTSTIKVEINDIQHLHRSNSENPLHVFITGKNERYMFDNQIGVNSREVVYEPPHSEVQDNLMITDIKIQRMVLNKHHQSATPVLLHIHHPITNEPIMEPLDIMRILVQVRDIFGNLVWPDQETIDREHEFPIKISITDRGKVVVQIREWILEDLEPII